MGKKSLEVEFDLEEDINMANSLPSSNTKAEFWLHRGIAYKSSTKYVKGSQYEKYVNAELKKAGKDLLTEMPNDKFDFDAEYFALSQIEPVDIDYQLYFWQKRLIQYEKYVAEHTSNHPLANIKFPGVVYSPDTYSYHVKLEIDFLKGQSKKAPIKPQDKSEKQIEPIIWSGTPGQLQYLFEQLRDIGLFPIAININATISQHFAGIGGKPFENISQAKTNYQNNLTSKPKKAKEIENIAQNTKNGKPL